MARPVTAVRRQHRVTAALLTCCFFVFSVGALPASMLQAEYLLVEPAACTPITGICETYVDAFSIDLSADVCPPVVRLAPDVHELFQAAAGMRQLALITTSTYFNALVPDREAVHFPACAPLLLNGVLRI